MSVRQWPSGDQVLVEEVCSLIDSIGGVEEFGFNFPGLLATHGTSRCSDDEGPPGGPKRVRQGQVSGWRAQILQRGPPLGFNGL